MLLTIFIESEVATVNHKRGMLVADLSKLPPRQYIFLNRFRSSNSLNRSDRLQTINVCLTNTWFDMHVFCEPCHFKSKFQWYCKFFFLLEAIIGLCSFGITYWLYEFLSCMGYTIHCILCQQLPELRKKYLKYIFADCHLVQLVVVNNIRNHGG